MWKKTVLFEHEKTTPSNCAKINCVHFDSFLASAKSFLTEQSTTHAAKSHKLYNGN
jgi:hypothetical protein